MPSIHRVCISSLPKTKNRGGGGSDGRYSLKLYLLCHSLRRRGRRMVLHASSTYVGLRHPLTPRYALFSSGPVCLRVYISSILEQHILRWNRILHVSRTKRIQPARGWCATVGGTVRGNTVQIVSTYPASPEARPPSFLGKPAVRSRSMAGGAPTPCGRH